MIDENDELICELLFKQIIDCTTDEEKEYLNHWRKQSEKHERLYNRLLDTHFQELEYRRRKSVHVKRPLEEMQRRIKAENHRTQRITWKKWAVAASIAMLLCVGLYELSSLFKGTIPDNLLVAQWQTTTPLEIKPVEPKSCHP